MLTVVAPNAASSSTNVTQTHSRSSSTIPSKTFRPRKIASSTVVEVKISFMMTTLRGVAWSRISRIRSSSSCSLPCRSWRFSPRSKWVNMRSARNSRAWPPGTGRPRLAR